MPLDDMLEMASQFQEVLAVDPLSAGLFVFGNILLLGSIGVFGILTLGAVLSLFRRP